MLEKYVYIFVCVCIMELVVKCVYICVCVRERDVRERCVREVLTLTLRLCMCVCVYVDMKKALYAICCQFGSVIDIVVMKTFRLRGQAWVVFESVPAATNAMRSLAGFEMFGKEIVRALKTHIHTHTYTFTQICANRSLCVSMSCASECTETTYMCVCLY